MRAFIIIFFWHGVGSSFESGGPFSLGRVGFRRTEKCLAPFALIALFGGKRNIKIFDGKEEFFFPKK